VLDDLRNHYTGSFSHLTLPITDTGKCVTGAGGIEWPRHLLIGRSGNCATGAAIRFGDDFQSRACAALRPRGAYLFELVPAREQKWRRIGDFRVGAGREPPARKRT